MIVYGLINSFYRFLSFFVIWWHTDISLVILMSSAHCADPNMIKRFPAGVENKNWKFHRHHEPFREPKDGFLQSLWHFISVVLRQMPMLELNQRPKRLCNHRERLFFWLNNIFICLFEGLLTNIHFIRLRITRMISGCLLTYQSCKNS